MDTLIFLAITIAAILSIGSGLTTEYAIALIGLYYLYLGLRAFLNKPNWSLRRSIEFTERKYIIADRKKYLRLEGTFNLLIGTAFILNSFLVNLSEDIPNVQILIIVIVLATVLYYFLLNKLFERKTH